MAAQEAICPVDGKPLGGQRNRVYCSARCRQRAARRRALGLPLDTPPQARYGLRHQASK